MFGSDYLLEAPGQDHSGVSWEQAPPRRGNVPPAPIQQPLHFAAATALLASGTQPYSTVTSALTKERAAHPFLFTSLAPETTSDMRDVEWWSLGDLPIL